MSRESLKVLAADNVGRLSGREEATSIRISNMLLWLLLARQDVVFYE